MKKIKETNTSNKRNNRVNSEPSKDLLVSLKEIEDYKKGKVQLPCFATTEELFKYLDN